MKVKMFLSFACRAVTAAAAILLLGDISAEARPRHAHSHHAQTKQSAEPCFFLCSQADSGREHKGGKRATALSTEATGFVQSQTSASDAAPRGSKDTVVGGRPAGCPHKWCGCQASIEVFGRILPYLNKAANWLVAFPHVAQTAGSPGMAAARRDHVVVLRKHIEGTRWEIKDGNYSGAAHIRELDLRASGYTIVDPHAGKLAMN